MAEAISEEQVRRVATLSRLRLSDEEVHHFTDQLRNVLGYIATLEELDVAGVEPLAHPLDLTNVFREDVEGEPLSVEAALRNAPATEGPFFRVPKVLGDGGGA